MIDYGYEVQDSATFTTSGAGTIASVAKVVDWGAGKLFGEAVFDVTAIEIASNNEFYNLLVQGSNVAAFTGTYTTLAALELGALEVIDSDLDSAVGRYRLPFCNEMPDGTKYRYGRVYCAVGGSVATGITFSAHIEPPKA